MQDNPQDNPDVNQPEPNLSAGAPNGALLSRPTSSAACGPPVDSGTAGCGRTLTVPRVLRVQCLADTKQLDTLRLLAGEAARFGNGLLADFFAKAMGYHHDVPAYKRLKRTLSSAVRDAVNREALAIWRKHGRAITGGSQRLAMFSAEKALVARGKLARVLFDGHSYTLSIRLVGEDKGPAHVMPLWWKPQNETYITPALQQISSQSNCLKKVTFLFERRTRKMFALLCYMRTLTVPEPGQREAALGPLEQDGALWMRMTRADGRPITVNYTNRVERLIHMKLHFAGLIKRLRHRTRRTGRGHKQAYRRALVRAGSFSRWADDMLHQWSKEIIDHCVQNGVGCLRIGPIEHQDLPMARFKLMIEYKAVQKGIIIERFDPAVKEVERSVTQPIERQRKKLVAQRKALATLREAL